MKASDLFVKCLEAEGVEYIFGVPGEENAHFMISLEESDKIQFILCRHEQGAAFMAEAYGRLTGRVAGCLGTLGPGATNLITGVADGNMDRAPMLVFDRSGCVDSTAQGIPSDHGCCPPCTALSPNGHQQVHHPDNIPENRPQGRAHRTGRKNPAPP